MQALGILALPARAAKASNRNGTTSAITTCTFLDTRGPGSCGTQRAGIASAPSRLTRNHKAKCGPSCVGCFACGARAQCVASLCKGCASCSPKATAKLPTRSQRVGGCKYCVSGCAFCTIPRSCGKASCSGCASCAPRGASLKSGAFLTTGSAAYCGGCATGCSSCIPRAAFAGSSLSCKACVGGCSSCRPRACSKASCRGCTSCKPRAAFSGSALSCKGCLQGCASCTGKACGQASCRLTALQGKHGVGLCTDETRAEGRREGERGVGKKGRMRMLGGVERFGSNDLKMTLVCQEHHDSVCTPEMQTT